MTKPSLPIRPIGSVAMRHPHGPHLWGPWTYSKRYHCLIIHPYPNESDQYTVDLSGKRWPGPGFVEHLLDHLSMKRWPVTPKPWTHAEMVAGLVHALLYFRPITLPPRAEMGDPYTTNTKEQKP